MTVWLRVMPLLSVAETVKVCSPVVCVSIVPSVSKPSTSVSRALVKPTLESALTDPLFSTRVVGLVSFLAPSTKVVPPVMVGVSSVKLRPWAMLNEAPPST